MKLNFNICNALFYLSWAQACATNSELYAAPIGFSCRDHTTASCRPRYTQRPHKIAISIYWLRLLFCPPDAFLQLTSASLVIGFGAGLRLVCGFRHGVRITGRVLSCRMLGGTFRKVCTICIRL